MTDITRYFYKVHVQSYVLKLYKKCRSTGIVTFFLNTAIALLHVITKYISHTLSQNIMHFMIKVFDTARH